MDKPPLCDKVTFFEGEYISSDQFFSHLSLYATVHVFDDHLSIPLVKNNMGGLFFDQKTNNIRISYSLKYKSSKKKIIYEKINNSVGWAALTKNSMV